MQDDWQIAPRIKLLYGLRYDLFDVPESRPYCRKSYSNNFTIDKNNCGPRAGAGLGARLTNRTVLRASIGKMFEPPLHRLLRQSILNNGDPLRFNASIARHQRRRAGVPHEPCAPRRPAFVLPEAEHHGGRSAFRTQRPG